MHQKRSASRLGRRLSAARKCAGYTQAELAAEAHCSVRTVFQAERGSGRADSFLELARATGMEIAGRSLPPGGHLGGRLLALRQRTGFSRGCVSQGTGISRTTLAALEAGRAGHLSVVESVAEFLGAGLTLVPRGHGSAFYGSVALSSAWDAWASPQALLDRLYAALGAPLDLDPCSPGRSRCRVRAAVHYTEDDDGLALPWHGLVYMNPPYGRSVGQWTAKARAEAEAGRAVAVIGLLPARTDTLWWHRDVAARAHVFLLKGRLAFGAGDSVAPFPSAVVAWGASEALLTRLADAFADHWQVPAEPRLASVKALAAA
jgi:transcriptional regulator with XRE-family HTH domain